MRRILLLLLSLSLSACVNDTASYNLDGRDNAVTVKIDQDKFWIDQLTIALIVSRLPDCQRTHLLTPEPAADLELALYVAGENSWIIRSSQQAWQFSNDNCDSLLDASKLPVGERLGTFKFDKKKFIFEPTSAATPAPAAN